MKKMNKKGFTLAELLIVVAIIAVLVAVAIPVFSTQLEKSRQATDLANLRSSYAEAMASYLTDNSGEGASYKMQTKDGNLSKVGTANVDAALSTAIANVTTLKDKSAAVSVSNDASNSTKVVVKVN